MYSSHVLTTLSLLSLPLSILAAPAPTLPTLYKITAASVAHKQAVVPEGPVINRDLSFTVHGVNPGNFDIVCAGSASVPWKANTKPVSVQLVCPQDQAGVVKVTVGVDQEIAVSVQW
ncbi:MAG: hypothetical protein Q9199_008215 [Rusavskia elegans]